MKMRVVVMAVLTVLAATAAGFAADDYSIPVGATVTVDEHGQCREVTNPAGQPMARFISTKTAPEWQSVIDNPNALTLAACSGGESCESGAWTWTGGVAPAGVFIHRFAYGNGIYVGVGQDGASSPDADTWTKRTLPAGAYWADVEFAAGKFVAVGGGSNRVATSTDGITWTARTPSQANDWISLAYGNGLFVAISYSGTNRVMTSPDGITWTARTAAAANAWSGISFGNGIFLAAAPGGTNRIMTSPDGITWTARTPPASSWKSIAYGNGTFLVSEEYIQGDGKVGFVRTTDGVTWSAVERFDVMGFESSGLSHGFANGIFFIADPDLFVQRSYLLKTDCGATGGGGSCGAGGVEVGGNCWYAAENQSCSDVCASRGGCNLAATRDYAGSGGTDANCKSVLDALSLGSGNVLAISSPSDVPYASGGGCSYLQTAFHDDYRIRQYGPTTCEATASMSTTTRACACGGSPPTANCTTPWGENLANGDTVQAFKTQTVPNGQSCDWRNLTCRNGALVYSTNESPYSIAYGTYPYKTCTVEPPSGNKLIVNCLVDLENSGDCAEGTSTCHGCVPITDTNPTNCAPLNGQFWETRNDYNGSDGYYYGRTVDIQWLCVAP